MFIVSTLLHGVFSQREFVRESDARVCFWNFIAVMPNDGDGDEFNRNGTDHDGHDWGVTFSTNNVEQASPESEVERALQAMVCALSPSTYSVSTNYSPLHDRMVIIVRDESDRGVMWVHTDNQKDSILVKARKGWSETKVLFEGSQGLSLIALDSIRNYFALRG